MFLLTLPVQLQTAGFKQATFRKAATSALESDNGKDAKDRNLAEVADGMGEDNKVVAPTELCCPMSHKKLVTADPAVAADECPHEHSANEDWFKTSKNSPPQS